MHLDPSETRNKIRAFFRRRTQFPDYPKTFDKATGQFNDKLIGWYGDNHFLSPDSTCERVIWVCHPAANHYFAVVADLVHKVVYIADSLHEGYKRYHKLYVAAAYAFLHSQARHAGVLAGENVYEKFLGAPTGAPSKWKLVTAPLGHPQQEEPDCGIFMLAAIESICKGEMPSCTKENIPDIRLRILASIVERRYISTLTKDI